MNNFTKITFLILVVITCSYCFANILIRKITLEYKLSKNTTNKIEIVEINNHDYIIVNAIDDADINSASCKAIAIIHDVNCSKCNQK